MPSDFTVFDAAGRPSAFIEARRRHDTSATWATRLRRNMLAHGTLPHGSVFALITPDKLYTWPADAGPDDGPDFEGDSSSLLGPYFSRVDATPASIEDEAFELLVSWWLQDLSANLGPETDRGVGLVESGLFSTLAGARIVRQDAA